MQIKRVCPFTGAINVRFIEGVTREALDEWRAGVLIQDAMPKVTREDRKFIKTGITPSMWNEIFGAPRYRVGLT